MPRDVIISIKPEWVEKIISGEKTIELRKSFPKQVTPFRCFIYVSQDFTNYRGNTDEVWTSRGKIIGVVNILKDITTHSLGYYKQCGDDCLSNREREDYLGGKVGHGWLLRNVKVYDEPRPLSGFYLDRAPQSWCYVPYYKKY